MDRGERCGIDAAQIDALHFGADAAAGEANIEHRSRDVLHDFLLSLFSRQLPARPRHVQSIRPARLRPASVNAFFSAATLGPKMVLPILLAPLVRAHQRVKRALEARHHVASEQFVAAPGLLAVRPVVRAEQEAAEAAVAVFEQPLDALDDGLRGADQRTAILLRRRQRIVVAAGRAAERIVEIIDRFEAARPFATSRSACSSSSATCTFITTRQSRRFMVLPCLAAVSSAMRHCRGIASSRPAGRRRAKECQAHACPRKSAPPASACWRARSGNAGHCTVSGASRASRIWNQSVFIVTGSSHFSSAMMASSDSSIRRR